MAFSAIRSTATISVPDQLLLTLPTSLASNCAVETATSGNTRSLSGGLRWYALNYRLNRIFGKAFSEKTVSTPSDLDICLPPSAPDLLESMRAIGYSFEAAIADIIDNSIAASAARVDVLFGSQDGPYVAILDDGGGMSAGELVAAMRHGNSNPNNARAASDLGSGWV
jgi:hypothetical protein